MTAMALATKLTYKYILVAMIIKSQESRVHNIRTSVTSSLVCRIAHMVDRGRLGQAANLGVAPNPTWPSTFMAAALDLPNTVETGAPAGGVHLMDKRTIAHRLALGAQGTVYAHLAQPELVWAGPRFKSIDSRIKSLNSSATVASSAFIASSKRATRSVRVDSYSSSRRPLRSMPN